MSVVLPQVDSALPWRCTKNPKNYVMCRARPTALSSESQASPSCSATSADAHMRCMGTFRAAQPPCAGGWKCALVGVPWRGSVSARLAWGDIVSFNMLSKVMKMLSILKRQGTPMRAHLQLPDMWLRGREDPGSASAVSTTNAPLLTMTSAIGNACYDLFVLFLRISDAFIMFVIEDACYERCACVHAGVCEQTATFAGASPFPLQSSSRNRPPAPDLVFLKLILPYVLFSRGVLFSQTPVSRRIATFTYPHAHKML